MDTSLKKKIQKKRSIKKKRSGGIAGEKCSVDKTQEKNAVRIK